MVTEGNALECNLLSHLSGLSRMPSYIVTQRPAYTDGTSPSTPRGLPRLGRRRGFGHPLVAGFRPPRPRLSGVPFRLFRNAKRKIFMRLAGSSRPGTGFPASHAPHMALALVGQAGLEPATHCHMEPVHQPIAQSHYLLRHCPILPVFPGWAGNHSQRVRLAITLPDGFWRCITLRSERRTRTQKKGLLVAGFRPPRPRLSVVPFRLFRNANKKEILEGCPGPLAGASGFEPAAAPLRRPFPWQDPACHGPVFPGCQQNKPGESHEGLSPPGGQRWSGTTREEPSVYLP